MTAGSDGIPCTGKEAEYATQLWLADPSAFWLHPEGPLSETTPDEWLAKQVPKATPIAHHSLAALMNVQSQYSQLQLATQFANYQNQLAQQQRPYGVGNLLGVRWP